MKNIFLPLIYVLSSSSAFADSSQKIELRGFYPGQECVEAFSIAEAKRAEGIVFNPKWGDGQSACQPEVDGTGFRGLGMGAFRRGYKDVILVSVNSKHQVYKVEATTLWFFHEGTDAPPEIDAVVESLLTKFGVTCAIGNLLDEVTIPGSAIRSKGLGLLWMPGQNGEPRCSAPQTFNDSGSWKNFSEAAAGLTVSATVSYIEKNGRPNSVEMKVILNDSDSAAASNQPKIKL